MTCRSSRTSSPAATRRPSWAGRFARPSARSQSRTAWTGAEAELVAGLDLGPRMAVVGDENTWPILGARVAAALPGAETIVLDHPKADEATADLLQERCRHVDALIAVGSGTLNDLCKYVTHRTDRRCAVFATAPSMDGYVTTTVSITRDGFKLSLPAHAPDGRVLRPWRTGRGACADDAGRPRRHGLPHHGTGRLAAVPSAARHGLRRDALPADGRGRAAALRPGAPAARGRPRRHAAADAHADPVGPGRAGHPHQPLRLDGRALDQPLHRHLRQPASEDPAWRARSG